MEGHMDDCLYEDLPDICEASSSLSNENGLSSSLSNENGLSSSLSNENRVSSTLSEEIPTPSSFTTENPIKKSHASIPKTKRSPKKCACHESVQWTWDNSIKSDCVEIINNNMDVRFHKNYSNGTAVARCTEPMTNNQYYWEVEMTYPVYGTDVMIGVGTSEAMLNDIRDRFVSFLGMDNKTWGFSYTGLFHHNGLRRCYAESFGQGSIIGVHLDLWKGTLSFYKDKKHLGVASSGLKGKTLYAMASSTAARSGMRIIRSCSFPSSLQFLCCTKLREIIPDDKNVLDVIIVPPGLKQFLQKKLGWLLEKRHLEKVLKTCCVGDDNQSDEDDESSVGSVIGNLQDPDPFNITGQFVLLGSFLLSNHNRFQQAFSRSLSSDDSEDSSESEAKRRRSSDSFVGLSDHESD